MRLARIAGGLACMTIVAAAVFVCGCIEIVKSFDVYGFDFDYPEGE